jgi:hypothetical protein
MMINRNAVLKCGILLLLIGVGVAYSSFETKQLVARFGLFFVVHYCLVFALYVMSYFSLPSPSWPAENKECLLCRDAGAKWMLLPCCHVLYCEQCFGDMYKSNYRFFTRCLSCTRQGVTYRHVR